MDKSREHTQEDANKIIEVLFRISKAVSNARDLNELYKAIHKNLGDILNVDNFLIALHHEKKDSITFPYYVDEKNNNPKEILNSSKIASITGRVIKDKKPLIFVKKDIIQFANSLNQKPIGTVPEIWLGAPLIINNKSLLQKL